MKKAILFSLAMGLGISTSVANASTCAPETEKAQVSAVYPTADTLPENLLRFYIYFSKPMQRRDILTSIYLTDASGQRLDGVFLDNRFDLWSADNTRLTLLFDPGRVKTGLVAHNAMGRALIPGEHYQLVVDRSAIDANGCTMASRFTKAFAATTADYEAPDVSQWQIGQIQQGSKEALTVDLNGAMDHVSLAYRIRVKDTSGQSVPGRLDLAKHEQRWVFRPKEPWDQGPYQLTVDAVLEDVAGNRLTGLFDQPSLAKESEAQGQWISIEVPVVNP